jgi:uncharacterized protein (TIGR02996 family)
MSDDEAFIRAIVDAPGDDAPRLIYADWLDERGDARGEYLRAEVASARRREWSKQHPRRQMWYGKAANLFSLANTLDSEWVSRVTRPPYGICYDRSRAFNCGPVLCDREIQEFESKLQARLPSDYRGFLRNLNGGRFERSSFMVPGLHQPEPEELDLFLRLLPEESSAPRQDQILNAFAALQNTVPNQLPIALTIRGEFVTIGLEGQCWNHVYFVSKANSPFGVGFNVHGVASTLSEFLDVLQLSEVEWVAMIRDGDVEGFVSWLNTEGHADALDRRTGNRALTHAVGYKQPEIVRELLDRGAELPSGLRDLAELCGNQEVVSLIRTAWEDPPYWKLRAAELERQQSSFDEVVRSISKTQ